jgi:hypothetical protein
MEVGLQPENLFDLELGFHLAFYSILTDNASGYSLMD